MLVKGGPVSTHGMACTPPFSARLHQSIWFLKQLETDQYLNKTRCGAFDNSRLTMAARHARMTRGQTGDINLKTFTYRSPIFTAPKFGHHRTCRCPSTYTHVNMARARQTRTWTRFFNEHISLVWKRQQYVYGQNAPWNMYFNSLRPSDAFMRRYHHWFRQWLVAWSAPSHYLNQCWHIVNLTLMNKLQWNFNRNANISIQENVFESVVCEMAAISSRPQSVKSTQSEACQYGGIH